MLNSEIISKYNYKNFKILYSEDEKETNKLVTDILNKINMNVTSVYDGLERFNALKNNHYDILITDINMQKMDGIKLIENAININPDIKIIVISAHTDTNYFLRTIKYKIEKYLLKPLRIEELISSIYNCCVQIQEKRDYLKNNQLLKQYQEITDIFSNVSKTDINGKITYVNNKFCETTEYTLEELIGNKHTILKHSDNSPEIYEDLWDTIKNKKKIWSGVLKNKKKNGDTFYFQMSIKPLLNENNEIESFISLREDVSLIITPKQKLIDYIKNFKNCLLLSMKIDSYDIMEKFYGEKVISEVCKRYKIEILDEAKKINKNFDKIFYLENGWYALASKDFIINDVLSLNKEITLLQDNLKNKSFIYQSIDYDFTLTISYSYDSKDLYESARFGLKHRILNKIPLLMSNEYAKIEQEKAQKNIQTIDIVKTALMNHKIISYFQPIINNKTKEIEKYESLVRLVDENNKVVSPFFFLDVAKKGNYYTKITNMVLENSFNALMNTNITISINLSIIDIEKEETRKKVYELLEKYKDYCQRVIFELLEDEETKDFQIVKTFIKNVKSMGIKIAIDDFGSGYSNFERLLEYEPDILKIDGSLIKNIETNKYSLDIVETIVTFAKKSNIITVAEYVENENIFNILKNIGIDYSQGYYFGKPERIEKIIEYERS